jgi:hypothetical protein
MSPEFLESPNHIRHAVGRLATKTRRMDLAVAFVGPDWRDALANFNGNLRVLCWLSSTNTNPYAVRQLMKRPRTEVRQRNRMHAKVYVADFAVVVGSANLSAKALSELEVSGQDEAAVLVKDRKTRNTIANWFRDLWDAPGTKRITNNDLRRAAEAYRKAHKARQPSRAGSQRADGLSIRPARRRALAELARAARKQDVATEFGWLKDIRPQTLTTARLLRLVNKCDEWVGRRFLFERAFLKHDRARVRRALVELFNESSNLVARLEKVINSGALTPLRVPTLSLLLSFFAPERYPPFDRRTNRFLKDFRLKKRGVSAASPTTYKRWLDYATELSQELDLPTPGHVDRIVWEYTKDMKL